MARRPLLMLALAGLLATAACANSGPTPKVEKPHGAFSSYVAIGDSNTAGPGINPVDRGSGACARAKNNYPALLAKELKISSVRDVSCTGARIEDITEARPIADQVPGLMIDAVTAETQLVTVSIGGNNENALSGIALLCLTKPYNAAKCGGFIDLLDKILKRTTKELTSALKIIKTKAPKARVVFVDYLNLFPPQGRCVVTGFDPASVPPARAGMLDIRKALKTAAKRAKVEYVSMADRSSGHESCYGKRAWVNGAKGALGDGAYLHPNANGMQAIARIVAAHLKDQQPN